MTRPKTQAEAVGLLVDVLKYVENVNKTPEGPSLFALYRYYNAMTVPEKQTKPSFGDWIEPLAVNLDEKIDALSEIDNFHMPQESANLCPVIAGSKVCVASQHLLGLTPSATKYRREFKKLCLTAGTDIMRILGIRPEVSETKVAKVA